MSVMGEAGTFLGFQADSPLCGREVAMRSILKYHFTPSSLGAGAERLKKASFDAARPEARAGQAGVAAMGRYAIEPENPTKSCKVRRVGGSI